MALIRGCPGSFSGCPVSVQLGGRSSWVTARWVSKRVSTARWVSKRVSSKRVCPRSVSRLVGVQLGGWVGGCPVGWLSRGGWALVERLRERMRGKRYVNEVAAVERREHGDGNLLRGEPLA